MLLSTCLSKHVLVLTPLCSNPKSNWRWFQLRIRQVSCSPQLPGEGRIGKRDPKTARFSLSEAVCQHVFQIGQIESDRRLGYMKDRMRDRLFDRLDGMPDSRPDKMSDSIPDKMA